MYTQNIFSLFILSIFFMVFPAVQAEEGAQGAAYYSSSPGVAPKVYVLKKIRPVDGFIMPVELQDGTSMDMDTRAVYALVDYQKIGLADVKSPADFKKLQEDQAKLEKMSKDFPALEAWTKPKIKELREETALFEKGQRKHAGQWLTAEAIKAKEDAEKAKQELVKLKSIGNSTTATLGTVTTKQGKSYSAFEVTRIDIDCVAIRHSSGIARIHYKDMPEDLTAFPESLRAQILEKKEAWEAAQGPVEPAAAAEVPAKP